MPTGPLVFPDDFPARGGGGTSGPPFNPPAGPSPLGTATGGGGGGGGFFGNNYTSQGLFDPMSELRRKFAMLLPQMQMGGGMGQSPLALPQQQMPGMGMMGGMGQNGGLAQLLMMLHGGGGMV